MNPCIPEPVKPTVEDYTALLNAQLPDQVVGFYLVGSIALGEFHERFSDIDFVSTLNEQATSKEIEAFRSIHRTITTKVRAGEYALGCLPVHWHKLIQEAIDIRKGKEGLAYRLRISRMIEAVNFLRYIIQLCNTSYPLK